jgi:dienelactone hydrolase
MDRRYNAQCLNKEDRSMKSTRISNLPSAFLFAVFLLLVAGQTLIGFAAEPGLPGVLREYSAEILQDEELVESYKGQTHRYLRSRRDEANRADLGKWRSIKGREDWEEIREQHLQRLRDSLGGFSKFPPKINAKINAKTTGTITGDGYVIENLVYESRRGFWVTANLYRPTEATGKMPGILINHSHHRPKVQDELQDMGMTWARSGCVVLVIDQVGHGERADHPFQSEADYAKKDSGYKWWRQDYYHRYDTNAQLHLIGQSLMGWMAWDLMRGVDLLVEMPEVDSEKIILLGAVAGGGDPAGVTAALDRRIAAAVPFNFGGPQPETRFPLPDDAELHFNYMGGAYWEGTRNLKRTGVDGFFHWVIVGSIPPRKLIYGHEFAWDKDRDPVWKRLNSIYKFYGEEDNIDYTLGRGSVRGRPPEATHCTNIGRHHRQRIHLAFKRWFDIDVKPDDEFSNNRDDEQLRSMTADYQRKLKPRKVYEVATELASEQLASSRKSVVNISTSEIRQEQQKLWRTALGEIEPGKVKQVSRNVERLADVGFTVERVALKAEQDGILTPMWLCYKGDEPQRNTDVVIAVAHAAPKQFLKDRAAEIAKLLESGHIVCLPEVRGVSNSRGSRGTYNDNSFAALMFETPMLGYRLRDLRAVMSYLRGRSDFDVKRFALWGDSFVKPNAADTDFQVPHRVSGRPQFSEPLGGLLAMLAGLYEDDVHAVFCRGSLSSYKDVLSGPHVYIPHDVVLPGILKNTDVPDLAASLTPKHLRLEGVVDGLNRTQSARQIEKAYRVAMDRYSETSALELSDESTNAGEWLVRKLRTAR